MKIFVTGGAGFIGSNFIRLAIATHNILNFDKLTYAGNLESLTDLPDSGAYRFFHGDLCDPALLEKLLFDYQPDAIVHFAAETHVDRSIDGPRQFISTNTLGSFNLFETARKYRASLTTDIKQRFRIVNVSTDEVFGSLGETGFFDEQTPFAPNSPYSASKASADHLARAYFHTYGLPVLTTHCSNNYGPFQFPEKLIPLMIMNAINNKFLPVYGDGMQVRDWLYVEDHCRAILSVMTSGVCGETYNIGGNNEMTNLQVVRTICALLDEIYPRLDGKSYITQIKHVQDRPGHDRRYAIDAGKIMRTLGWKPQETFDSGIRKTIEWYLARQEWCESVTSGKYRQERLGMGHDH